MSATVLVFEHSLALPFFGIRMKTDIFQFCGHCWSFQICWQIESSTLTVSSFRIWNSSAGIPSPPLALFTVMLPKARLTSHSRISGSNYHMERHKHSPGASRSQILPANMLLTRNLHLRPQPQQHLGGDLPGDFKPEAPSQAAPWFLTTETWT